MKTPMKRPDSLPARDDRDTRTPKEKAAAKRAAACFATPYAGAPMPHGMAGMIDTPTQKILDAVNANIDRKLAALRKKEADAAK